MSRSRRKRSIIGITTSPSEKQDKCIANRKERKRVRVILGQDFSADVLPHKREVSDVWSMEKDGKRHFDAHKHPKLMRK
ncbi:MAG TPA: hypothetical protein VL171_03215 [Verrucomicrobiae bacterium]|nr:hypothetical protein [Verrucomicrobiae bacterium]